METIRPPLQSVKFSLRYFNFKCVFFVFLKTQLCKKNQCCGTLRDHPPPRRLKQCLELRPITHSIPNLSPTEVGGDISLKFPDLCEHSISGSNIAALPLLPACLDNTLRLIFSSRNDSTLSEKLAGLWNNFMPL